MCLYIQVMGVLSTILTAICMYTSGSCFQQSWIKSASSSGQEGGMEGRYIEMETTCSIIMLRGNT